MNEIDQSMAPSWRGGARVRDAPTPRGPAATTNDDAEMAPMRSPTRRRPRRFNIGRFLVCGQLHPALPCVSVSLASRVRMFTLQGVGVRVRVTLIPALVSGSGSRAVERRWGRVLGSGSHTPRQIHSHPVTDLWYRLLESKFN